METENWRSITLLNDIDYPGGANSKGPFPTAIKVSSPHDGVLDHSYVLRYKIGGARRHKRDVCIACLDLANAFGSLPHSAILEDLSNVGTGVQFVKLIKGIYADSSTQILCDNG